MNEPMSPVREEELHAFVDGELPADRREAVTAWLVRASRAGGFGGGLAGAGGSDPRPLRRGRRGAGAGALQSRRADARRRRRRAGRGGPCAAAAVIAAFMVGGGAGWMARGATAAAPTSSGSITADALEAHQLYVVEVRHPVEVPGSERDHMTQWLSKRLGYAQRIPELQSLGLKLVGGRLLPGPTGAAAMYMYEGDSGERFTLYCAKTTTPESALRFREGEPLRGGELGRRQGRLRGVGSGRPRSPRAGRQGDLRADRQGQLEEVVRLCTSPGASCAADAGPFERTRLSRSRVCGAPRRARRARDTLTPYPRADRTACRRARSSSARRARRPCPRAARCARWRAGRRSRPWP